MEKDPPWGRDTSGDGRTRMQLVEADTIVQPKYLLQILHLIRLPRTSTVKVGRK